MPPLLLYPEKRVNYLRVFQWNFLDDILNDILE